MQVKFEPVWHSSGLPSLSQHETPLDFVLDFPVLALEVLPHRQANEDSLDNISNLLGIIIDP
jgi:hypothetical protein